MQHPCIAAQRFWKDDTGAIGWLIVGVILGVILIIWLIGKIIGGIF